MIKLSELIRPLLLAKVIPSDHDVRIRGLQIDSRNVQPGDLFIALRGFSVDGHRYVNEAVEKGAAAVLVEEPVDVTVPCVLVPDSRRAMAFVANTFYQNPTQQLKLIGVTGTNGKTTTVHLIQKILTDHGTPAGSIGTIHMQIGDRQYPVQNTTPEALDLQHGFRMMCDAGLSYAAIEVSSHALDLGRTRGCTFRTAVFTNLTQDHLDYHETMEQYREAKGLLFSQLGNAYTGEPYAGSMAVLNADDEASSYFSRITPAQVVTYGIEREADVRAEHVIVSADGTSFTLRTFRGSTQLNLQMVGKFSVYNALAAATVALIEGVPLQKIAASLESMTGVPGRFERVDGGAPFTVLVDYAHTPDSLENVLLTIRQFARGEVYCVVGCGGDRDRAKRPIMARIAASQSDVVVLTSDNPRTEDPEAIVADMLTGLDGVPAEKYQTIIDRRQAIDYAIERARPGDVVLIAGKGHETYQEIHGVRYNFDDREVAQRALREKYGEERINEKNM